MKKVKFLIWVFPILVSIMIFSFSADTGEESTGISFPLTIDIMEKWNDTFHLSWSENTVLMNAENMEFLVRKAGHMSEYALLSISVMTACAVSLIISKRQCVITFLFCVLYAASDEIHQLFVPGRCGKITDVCIDSVGVLIGIFLFLGVMRMIKRGKEKNKTNKMISK